MGWIESPDDLETYWPQCQEEAYGYQLNPFIVAAKTQCLNFAPALPVGADVPESYRLAQAMQTRALWRSQKAGAGNQIGADGMAVTVFPMDWTVKNLLRPKKGRPSLA